MWPEPEPATAVTRPSFAARVVLHVLIGISAIGVLFMMLIVVFVVLLVVGVLELDVGDGFT